MAWDGPVDGLGQVGQARLAEPAAEGLGDAPHRVVRADALPDFREQVLVAAAAEEEMGIGLLHYTMKSSFGIVDSL